MIWNLEPCFYWDFSHCSGQENCCWWNRATFCSQRNTESLLYLQQRRINETQQQKQLLLMIHLQFVALQETLSLKNHQRLITYQFGIILRRILEINSPFTWSVSACWLMHFDLILRVEVGPPTYFNLQGAWNLPCSKRDGHQHVSQIKIYLTDGLSYLPSLTYFQWWNQILAETMAAFQHMRVEIGIVERIEKIHALFQRFSIWTCHGQKERTEVKTGAMAIEFL